jgi:hypothetical protein
MAYISQLGIRASDILTCWLLQTPYSIPIFVSELHNGANMLLLHWHYFRRGEDPTSLAKGREKSQLSELTEEQFKFVIESYHRFREINQTRKFWTPAPTTLDYHESLDVEAGQRDSKWDDPLYWVSQMFEVPPTGWLPRLGYRISGVPEHYLHDLHLQPERQREVQQLREGEPQQHRKQQEQASVHKQQHSRQVDYGPQPAQRYWPPHL